MKPKNKGGRPKEDLSEKVDFEQVERLAELGHTDQEIGYILGYSKRTIDNWKHNEEFASLLKKGKAKADSNVIKSLYQRANGYEHEETQVFCYQGQIVTHNVIKKYPPDPTSMIFWLKNRKSDQWRDKQEIEHSGELKTVSQTTVFSLKVKGK